MRLQPSFFDIFGALGFIAIIVAAMLGLLHGGLLPTWMLIAILLIGIAGFIVDAAIVYRTYIKK